MTSQDRNDMLALVCEIADRAGRIILDYWGRAGVRYKADHSPVTDADLAAEAYILEQLAKEKRCQDYFIDILSGGGGLGR